MNDITQPLRLAVGSHEPGSGKGCAMNVISWENGDQEISDMPKCSDPFLARIVQNINDTYCTHREDEEGVETTMLCAGCSVKVLDLGHRTVGTGNYDRYAAFEVYLKLMLAELRKITPERKLQSKAVQVIQEFINNHRWTAAELQFGADEWSQIQDLRSKLADAAPGFVFRPFYTGLAVLADLIGHVQNYGSLYDIEEENWEELTTSVSGTIWETWRALNYPVKQQEMMLGAAHGIIDRFEEMTGLVPLGFSAEELREALRKMYEVV